MTRRGHTANLQNYTQWVEYDTKAGRLVGNFPQAFSHMSLVSAAQCLSGVHSRDSVRAK